MPSLKAGRLGDAILFAGLVESVVYAVPTGAIATIDIRIVNCTITPAKVRLYIGPSAVANVRNCVDYDITIAPGGVMIESGIPVSGDEKVVACADSAGVTVQVRGYEEAAE